MAQRRLPTAFNYTAVEGIPGPQGPTGAAGPAGATGATGATGAGVPGGSALNDLVIFDGGAFRAAQPTGDVVSSGSFGDFLTAGLAGVPFGAFQNNGLFTLNGGQITTTGVPNVGDMLYFNGSNWQSISAGSEGQVLKWTGGAPAWSLP